MRRIDGGYALEARLAYGGELECSRCLAPYPFEERRELLAGPVSPRQRQPADDVELDRGDLDVLYYDEPLVALSPDRRGARADGLPMKPLCKEDCLGLCPTCGKDLNQGPCACAPEIIDPRWEAFKALKEKV